jgi:hypothetical protein
MLIIENIKDYITEKKKDKYGEDRCYFEGIYMQGNIKNGNGRMYPTEDLQKAVDRYQPIIENHHAVGELNHPNSVEINPERICHKILELRRDGDNFVGKSLVTRTSMGQVVEALIHDNIQFGLSSRGMGDLIKKESYNLVQNFEIVTPADVVWDQSAPNAVPKYIIEGIMDNYKRVIDIFDIEIIEGIHKRIKGTYSKYLDEAIIREFNNIMKKL